jgi:hypothetical protein
MSAFVEMPGGLAQAFGGDSSDLGDADKWRIETIQNGNVVFMRFPVLNEKLPSGKSWIRVDAASMAKAQGFDLGQLQQFSGSDPRDTLKLLETVSNGVQLVGSEGVRGVQTNHYRGTVDLARYAKLFPADAQEQAKSLLDSLVQQSGLATMPVDVWVDADSQVRKLEMSMSAAQPGGTQSMDAKVAFEMYDYGKDVSIDLPPADEIVDVSALAGLNP